MWNQDLVEKYNISGPRYTSYPTALQFDERFAKADFSRALSKLATNKPLSLYIHIPFCDTICYYCACNKVVTKRYEKAEKYLEYLFREIRALGALAAERPVVQIHWGGGTPTFLSDRQIAELMNCIKTSFNCIDQDHEFSIEIDPRRLGEDTLATLKNVGFNRLSLGIQDFNPQVQKAVNRVQSEQMTRAVIEKARQLGFESINVDLIYGLPHQTVATFSQTIEKIIDIKPDRLSIFNYAHLPHRFKPQRRIQSQDLPSAKQKLQILEHTIKRLTEADYCYIGMDHFALPDDELTIAQQQGKLHRNFQGYTTHAECDLIGLGVSSISQIGSSYSQNQRDLETYYADIDQFENAVWRGCQMSTDDIIRRQVIMALICHFELDFSLIEKQYGIQFGSYFSAELKRLDSLQQDGLLQLEANKIKVTNCGRLLIRNICMIFDVYINELTVSTSYSKAI